MIRAFSAALILYYRSATMSFNEAIPRICVCTAPDTPIVHRSLLVPALNCGDIADGGGWVIVVFILPLVVILLSVPDWVQT